MSIIKIMDSSLSNQIAAGEVAESVSAIIKELVENSIDAKASEITIFIVNNGLSQIKVIDNGIGMSKTDAKLAFLRHATSKIRTQEDLKRIKTLGFRGEALAAILSVSKIFLKTKQANGDGFFLKFEDSKIIEEGVIAANEGSEITIEELFYNTPARLKYIKSEFIERFQIINIFNRLALGNPQIRFKLIIDDKLVKETYGNNDYYELISNIYGKNISKNLLYFKNNFGKIKITGYITSPFESRSNKKDINIFLNGRYITNYTIINAIIEGYHSFLMVNRYPLAVILIEMDPILFDVNVHPQKMIVKFINESLLKFNITNFIKEKLLNTNFNVPSFFKDEKNEFKEETQEKKANIYVQQLFDLSVKEEIEESKLEDKKLPLLDYIGTLAGTYLLFQNDEGLYLIDQHAAEERINYEYYFEYYGNLKIIRKNMLISRKLNLTSDDINLIAKNIQKFNEIGFKFDSNFNLITHPSFILDNDLETSINILISMILDKNKFDLKILLDNLAKTKSCKTSIKANFQISKIEIQTLISRLRNTKNPYTCPHGRPTIVKITYYEIERLFKRIV